MQEIYRNNNLETAMWYNYSNTTSCFYSYMPLGGQLVCYSNLCAVVKTTVSSLPIFLYCEFFFIH